MKRVLVTGGNGFIGRHVLPLLQEKNYEIHSVSRTTIRETDLNCTWHQVDLMDSQETKRLIELVRPSHLLHLAWEATPGEYTHSIRNYLWVQASLSLVQHFCEYGGKRAVFAGSCAEYDWKYGYLLEDMPQSSDTPYAMCKNALNMLIQSFSKSVGLSSCWGRVFFVYGPHEHPKRLVPSVITSLLKDQEVLCTHGNQYRDYLHVYDVATAFVSLLDSEIEGVVNISSGESIRLKEIINKIIEKLDKSSRVQWGAIPYPEGESLLIVGNNERLLNKTSWIKKYTIEEGIENTILWWEKHLL